MSVTSMMMVEMAHHLMRVARPDIHLVGGDGRGSGEDDDNVDFITDTNEDNELERTNRTTHTIMLPPPTSMAERKDEVSLLSAQTLEAYPSSRGPAAEG